MNVFTIWLVLVVAWNFGYPEATPLEDVIVAIILSLFRKYLAKALIPMPPIPIKNIFL